MIFRSSKYSLALGVFFALGMASHTNANANANASILTVGPGGMYAKPCQALTVAAEGDEIDIDARGSYVGDVCSFSANKLTIRGVNGRPKIDAGGLNAAGKGIWVVGGIGTIVENVELTGAKVPDHNGAGIRLDGIGLTVRNCFIHDNEDGILTDNNGVGDILIEYSEFGHNGYGDGRSHNVYVGHVHSLTFRYSYSHDANVGHDLKTRATINTITYNRFSSTPPGQLGDTASGQPSYEIDVPNAGTTYVIGNVIEQPALNQNATILFYGEEGVTNPADDLYVVNNTFLNDASTGTFINVYYAVKTPVLIQNNVFAGPGTVTTQATAVRLTNYQAMQPAFVSRAQYNLWPAPGAPFINAGSAPGVSREGVQLAPTMEYTDAAHVIVRPVVGNIDIGAYEAPAP
jgi:hypothetical protein